MRGNLHSAPMKKPRKVREEMATYVVATPVPQAVMPARLAFKKDLFAHGPEAVAKETVTVADRAQQVPSDAADEIEKIFQMDKAEEHKYRKLLKIEPALNRQLVSFQANKNRAVYRWCKFKEGFSAGLIEYFLDL